MMEREKTWEAGIQFSMLLLPAGCSVRGGGGKQVLWWKKQGHCRSKVGKDGPSVLGITYMFLPTVRRLQLWQMHYSMGRLMSGRGTERWHRQEADRRGGIGRRRLWTR